MTNKTVLVFGTFDGLHPGHINFFKQARRLGDTVLAVIARDKTVEAVKGRPPRQNEQKRLQAVQQLPLIDSAFLGNLDDKYQIIEELHPDIIALGYDQNAFVDTLAAELEARKIQAKIVRLDAFHPDKYKSSKLVIKD